MQQLFNVLLILVFKSKAPLSGRTKLFFSFLFCFVVQLKTTPAFFPKTVCFSLYEPKKTSVYFSPAADLHNKLFFFMSLFDALFSVSSFSTQLFINRAQIDSVRTRHCIRRAAFPSIALWFLALCIFPLMHLNASLSRLLRSFGPQKPFSNNPLTLITGLVRCLCVWKEKEEMQSSSLIAFKTKPDTLCVRRRSARCKLVSFWLHDFSLMLAATWEARRRVPAALTVNLL